MLAMFEVFQLYVQCWRRLKAMYFMLAMLEVSDVQAKFGDV